MKATEKIEIVNNLGLHLRAAAELVKVAHKFKSQIMVIHGIHNANGKSLMGLMTLAAAQGTVLEVTAEGEDAKEALAALKNLIAKKFGEKE
jgi:phosphocarrier protein HPr